MAALESCAPLLQRFGGHKQAAGLQLDAARIPEFRRAVNDYLASLGLPALRPAFETVALAVGRGILAGSDAVWFISRGVVAEELDRGEMIVLPTGARFRSAG